MSTEEEIKSEVPEASGDVPVGTFLTLHLQRVSGKGERD